MHIKVLKRPTYARPFTTSMDVRLTIAVIAGLQEAQPMQFLAYDASVSYLMNFLGTHTLREHIPNGGLRDPCTGLQKQPISSTDLYTNILNFANVKVSHYS